MYTVAQKKATFYAYISHKSIQCPSCSGCSGKSSWLALYENLRPRFVSWLYLNISLAFCLHCLSPLLCLQHQTPHCVLEYAETLEWVWLKEQLRQLNNEYCYVLVSQRLHHGNRLVLTCGAWSSADLWEEWRTGGERGRRVEQFIQI